MDYINRLKIMSIFLILLTIFVPKYIQAYSLVTHNIPIILQHKNPNISHNAPYHKTPHAQGQRNRLIYITPGKSYHHHVQQHKSLSKDLLCLLINVRSIRNKIPIITDILTDYKPDILFLTETWLTVHDNILLNQLQTDGYELLHCSRALKRGGGVIAIINNNLKASLISTNNIENMDVLMFETTSHSFGLIYRPPSTDTKSLSSILDMICSLNTRKKQLVIIGDLNLPSTTPSHSKAFIETMSELDFEQIIDFPTHIKGNTLDLIFLQRSPDYNLNVSQPQAIPIPWSDHHLIRFNLPHSIESQPNSRNKD